MSDKKDMKALSKRQKEKMSLLASGHLSGTRSDEEFNDCLCEFKKQFPNKKIEELQAMCYDLFNKERVESNRKDALI